MKKVFCTLTAVTFLLTCFALPVLAEEADAGILYKMTAEDAGLWQHFTGTWILDENGLSVENDGNDVWYFAYIGIEEGWTDYVVEMDLMGVLAGGILFRVTDPAIGIDTFGGYYVGYDSAYAFFGCDNDNQWKTLGENGTDAVAAKPTPYAETMHWKLVVQGDTFTLYVEDMELPYIQTFDADNMYPAGGIGVRVSVVAGDESGYFSNIKVYEIQD